MNETSIISAGLFSIGVGLALCYFPYAFFSVVKWRQIPASLELAIEERTQNDNPTPRYEVRAVENRDSDGATKLVPVFQFR